MGLKGKIYAMGLGAGLMYFYDPEHGERRRSEFSTSWAKFQRDAEEYWNTTSRDLMERFETVKSGAQSTADTLQHDPQRVVQTVKSRAKAGISALGNGSMHGEQMPMSQVQASPSSNLLLALAGGGLTFYGLMRGGIKGTAVTFMGLRVLARGLSETPLGKVFGAADSQANMDADSARGRSVTAPHAYDATSTAEPAAGGSEATGRRRANRGEGAANASAAHLPAGSEPQVDISEGSGQAQRDLSSPGNQPSES